MSYSVALMKQLDAVDPQLRTVLWTILEEIEQHRESSVTKAEFMEVHQRIDARFEQLIDAQQHNEQRFDARFEQLIEAQQRSEQRFDARFAQLTEVQQRTEAWVGQLAEAQQRTEAQVGQLVEAQQRTEARVGQLAEVQQRTEAQVGQLAEAQQRTDAQLEKLTEAQQRTGAQLEKLTETQQRTGAQLEKLTEAQQRTGAQLEKLTEAQQRTEEQIGVLTGQMQGLHGHLGGLSKSVAYALENEAYRKLPGYVRNKYGIEIEERLIRTTIGGREINLFARAKRAGQAVLLVGESVLRLNDTSKLKQVRKHVERVQAEFGGEVLPLVITHFATPEVLAKAEAGGILVVQSYEWDFDED